MKITGSKILRAVTILIVGILFPALISISCTNGLEDLYNERVEEYLNMGRAAWAQTVAKGTGRSSFDSVAVASDGSVYAAGYIYGTGTFDFGGDGTVLADTGQFGTGNNIVLVKYNSSGTAQWARTVTAGPDVSEFTSVAVASDGSVYAAGYIYGTEEFSFGGTVTATGAYSGSNIVLVKYDSSGAAQWARTVTTGPDASKSSSVAVASDGSVYAAGVLIGDVTFEFGNEVTATGASDGKNIVLVKYNSSGTTQWAQTVGSASDYSEFSSVAVASDGSVYAAGYIYGTEEFSFGGTVTATGKFTTGNNIVLVKYNSSGTAQWARTVTTGPDASKFSNVAMAPDDSFYCAGYIYGLCTFDFGYYGTVPYNDDRHTFSNALLVKYR